MYFDIWTVNKGFVNYVDEFIKGDTYEDAVRTWYSKNQEEKEKKFGKLEFIDGEILLGGLKCFPHLPKAQEYANKHHIDHKLVNNSELETIVMDLLKKGNIKFEQQKTFDWLRNYNGKNKLYLDFYIPSKNLAIECQGKQHFKCKEMYYDSFYNKWYENTTTSQTVRDTIKYNKCKEHGIDIIYLAKEGALWLVNKEIYHDDNTFTNPNLLIESINAH
jgi:hypothetical protein